MVFVLAIGGILAFFILFALLKKLIKLMFFALFLLIIVLVGAFFLFNKDAVSSQFFSEESIQKVDHVASEGKNKFNQASQQLKETTPAEVKENLNKAFSEAKKTISEGIQKAKDTPPPEKPEAIKKMDAPEEEATPR